MRYCYLQINLSSEKSSFLLNEARQARDLDNKMVKGQVGINYLISVAQREIDDLNASSLTSPLS